MYRWEPGDGRDRGQSCEERGREHPQGRRRPARPTRPVAERHERGHQAQPREPADAATRGHIERRQQQPPHGGREAQFDRLPTPGVRGGEPEHPPTSGGLEPDRSARRSREPIGQGQGDGPKPEAECARGHHETRLPTALIQAQCGSRARLEHVDPQSVPLRVARGQLRLQREVAVLEAAAERLRADGPCVPRHADAVQVDRADASAEDVGWTGLVRPPAHDRPIGHPRREQPGRERQDRDPRGRPTGQEGTGEPR